MKKLLFIILSLALFTACERKIDEFQVSKGSADFSTYVAVGHSMLAGYADGALYHTSQQYSIPKLIAGQLQLAGSGNFVQPVVNSEFGIEYPGAKTKLVLGYSISPCTGEVSMGPVNAEGQLEPLQPVGYRVNNLAIPGAKSFHLLFPGYAAYNPYYARFATGAGNKVVDEIAGLNPTFFTLWLGDNDVLGYALAGGAADSITSPVLFQQAMGGVLTYLTANGAKGVVANIGDITGLPFFSTIPYNALVLTKSQADSINMALQIYQLTDTTRIKPYHAGPNPFLIADPTSPHPMFKVRQMRPGELVLMTVPQDSLKCMGMGIINRVTFMPYPIPGQYVLTAEEVGAIKAATQAYNAILYGLAAKFNTGFVDMNTKMKELQSGLTWDGIHLNTKFVTGGAFSLDGIHLNPRGSAMAANFFIDAINIKFGSTIPQLDITKYPGVIFP
ncbi:MAG TPA: hypothetical protein PKG48_11795 [Bacteroidales bacterium]|nr:hypothetical protein [Bacteroidales bacterium]